MIENFAKFDRADLSAIFGEQALLNISDANVCAGISIDSRTIKPNNAFVALVGEKIDGHSKVIEALDAGAAFAVISETWYAENQAKLADKPIIIVKDTLVALGDMANYYRHQFDATVIAVAGSNGKTTTKDMLAAVLSKKFNVLKTHHNFNNRIGVPLMLFSLSDSVEFAVIEIGTNEPGEVFLLSEMVAPDAGLITNIGLEHLEKLIDLDGVEMEETSLFGYMYRRNGLCFINSDDERLDRYASMLTKKYTYSSEKQAMLQAEIKVDDKLRPHIHLKTEELEFELSPNSVGLAAAYNSIAAAAVGLAYGVEAKDIIAALEEFKADDYIGYARMALQNVNGYLILNDCYNANPSSMLMSLKTLSLFQGKPRRAAVLGDMFELGDAAEQSHRDVLEYASDVCDEVFAIGSNMKIASETIAKPNVKHFDSFDSLSIALSGKQSDYAILLKGSRGMKMETLLGKL